MVLFSSIFLALQLLPQTNEKPKDVKKWQYFWAGLGVQVGWEDWSDDVS